MSTNLSPRDLAGVIGVSESSLKRWVDDGRLEAQRTSGGHRRIAIQEAIRFLRRSAMELPQPEMLGLPDLTSQFVSIVSAGKGDLALLDALRRGDAPAVRGLILAEFLLSRAVGPIFDGPLAYATNRLAEELRASGDGRLTAHRATELLTAAIDQVQSLIAPPAFNAPVATVCALSAGDPLAQLIAATAIKECGFTLAPDINAPSDPGFPLSIHNSGTVLIIACIAPDTTRTEIETALPELARLAARGIPVILSGAGRSALGAASGVLSAGSICELQAIARAVRAQLAEKTAKPDVALRGKALRTA
jgi:excisionase family DNA binding protein